MELSRLLDNEASKLWTVLTPLEAKSVGGAQLKTLDDQSVLASGPNPAGDAYELEYELPNDTIIHALQLEGLTHDSLPNNGPGRSLTSKGVFAMTSWKVRLVHPDGQQQDLEFQAAEADHSMNGNELKATGGWNITFGAGKDRHSYWQLAEPVAIVAGSRLQMQMQFNQTENWDDQNLGRFRILAAATPRAFNRQRRRLKVKGPWIDLAVAYAEAGRTDRAADQFEKVLARTAGFDHRQAIIDDADEFPELLKILTTRLPDAPLLQLAWARQLVSQAAEWTANEPPDASTAITAFQEAERLYALLGANDAWTTLKPVEIQSDNGAQFEVLEDGSILARGQVGSDTYTLIYETDLENIQGMRLEALTYDRFRLGGPGRHNSNFQVSELTLKSAPSGQPQRLTNVKLANARSDFGVAKDAIDGKSDNGWHVWPKFGQPHTAVFSLAKPLGDGEKLRLEVHIQQYQQSGDHLLGRFRLSFTNRSEAMLATRYQLSITDQELSNLFSGLGAAYSRAKRWKEAGVALHQAAQHCNSQRQRRQLLNGVSDFPEAIAELAVLCQDEPTMLLELVRHYADQGQPERAEAVQQQASAMLRKRLELDPANEGAARILVDMLAQPLDARPLVPTSELFETQWRYTTSKPSDDWIEEGFDDHLWQEGSGAFGESSITPEAVIRTEWDTPDLWLRRTFRWKPDSNVKGLLLRIHHDDYADVYINGKKVLTTSGYATDYCFYALSEAALNLLKEGDNTLAVYSHDYASFQVVDAGIYGVPYPPDELEPLFMAQHRNAFTDAWEKLALAYYVLGEEEAYDKVVKLYPEAAAGCRHLFIQRGQWDMAARNMQQALDRGDTGTETLNYARGIAFAHVAAGNMEEYRKTVALIHRRVTDLKVVSQARTLLQASILAPGMITDANRARIMRAADNLEQTQPDWGRRLRAAVHYRLGDYEKAVELFGEVNTGGGIELGYIGAMAHHQVGNQSLVEAFAMAPDDWMKEANGYTPAGFLPRSGGWAKWAMIAALRREMQSVLGRTMEP